MDPKFQHWHDRGMSWALCVRKAITSNFSAVFFSIWLLWRSSILFPSFFTFWPFKNENIVFLFFSSSILPYVQNLRRRKCRALLVLYTKKYIYILHSEEEYGRITEFKKMFHLSFGEIGILYVPSMAEGGNILNRISLNHDTLPLVFTFRVRYRVIKGKGKC